MTEKLQVTYNTWAQVANANPTYSRYHLPASVDVYTLYTGNKDVIYEAVVDADDFSTWSGAYYGTSVQVASRDDAHALLIGVSSPYPSDPRTTDDVLRVSIEEAEGSRYTTITPNWCNPVTWYYKAQKYETEELTSSGDNRTFGSLLNPWIDNAHGRYTDEDILTTEDGDIPRLKVYVDGVEKAEDMTCEGGDGDFAVDYLHGQVTFHEDVSSSGVITADFWKATTADWILKPFPNKKLKLISVEAQFSDDISIRDTLRFQAYGYSHVFAPHLVPDVLPSGILIPLGNPSVYKTFMDYVNEANGAMPIIKKTTNPDTCGRDLEHDIQTFPWKYAAITTLYSSMGMEIHITMDNNQPHLGQVATATLYCRSYDE